jgi:hypothetical protein
MADITEPISAYNAQYPYNNVTQTESGHFQEFDDTPGAERIRTQHRTGTFTEWQPDGTEVHKIVGNGYRVVVKDDNVIIEGKCNISITGNAELTIGGDAITHVKGSVQQLVEKDYNLVVKGDYNVTTSKDLNLNAVGSTSAVYVQAGDRMVLNTDLTVHGEILADSVYSEGAVTAGTGIHAGLPGSANPTAGISTLGGLNVGTVGPTVPGIVDATVSVNAGVSAFAPIVSDIFGSMENFRINVDRHVHVYHPGPGSATPTTPPTEPMEL